MDAKIERKNIEKIKTELALPNINSESAKEVSQEDLTKLKTAFLEAADKAMYKAKNTGRNRIVSSLLSSEDLEKKSMVHSNEKHFLFTGAHAQPAKKADANEK